MKKNYKKLVSLFLVFLFTASLFLGAKPNSVKASALSQNDLKALVKQALKAKIDANESKSDSKSGKLSESLSKGNPDENVRIIVQLEDKPAIEKGSKTTNSINSVKASQQNVINKVKALKGASVKRSFGLLVNGFSMNVKRSEISKIAAMPGVKCVTEAKMLQKDMAFAKNLTQAYSTWKDLGYKGEGMVVGIIDTGIDYTHKDMKITDTSKEKLHASDVAKLGGNGKFFTDKVPYGYNFADNNTDVIDANPSEQHGMHVSGIVAANGNQDEVDALKAVQGVAPEAQLLALKVFSNTPGQMDGAYDDDTIAAIEDAVVHKADVINISLGSDNGFQDENDPEQKAVKNATDNGTLVVISAGNAAISTTDDGWNDPETNLLRTVDTGTVGTPGAAKDSLCVASYENTDLTVQMMNYTSAGKNGTLAYATGLGSPEKTLSSPHSIVYCGLGHDTDFGAGDLTGEIALIERGDISFTEKVQNAEAKNAAGVIIFDKDIVNGGSNDPLSSMRLDAGLTVPVMGIGNADGYSLVDLLKNGDVKVAFTGKMGSIPNSGANGISPYTSWGPTPSLDFKPEITAPGGDIYSTQNNNKYVSMSGTSMAAPDVTGSEALIIQAAKKNMKLTGRDLVEYAKNTAINTAKVEMDKTNTAVPYSPREQGSGMIQIENAIKNSVIVTDDNGNSAVALKEIGSTKTFNLNLKNYSDKAETYNLGSIGVLSEKITDEYDHFSDYVIPGSSISFNGSSTVTVPANGQAKVSVTVTLPSSFATEQFAEGYVKFTSADSAVPSLSVPFIGFYGNWSKMNIFDSPKWDKTSLKKKEGLVSGSEDNYLGTQSDNTINPENIAISPAEGSLNPSVTPKLSIFRDAKTLNVDIVDNNNGKENVVRKVSTQDKVTKTTIEKSNGVEVYGNGTWDGTVYDKSTGKYVNASDGQYYVRVTAKVDLPDAELQALYMPVKVDTQAPTVNIESETVSDDNTTCTVTWKASDNEGGSGLMDIGAVLLNGKDSGSDVVYNSTTKEFSSVITLAKDAPNEIIVANVDYAGNIGIADSAVKSPVVFDNLTDGMSISAKDLNKDGKYEVTGRVTSDVSTLTINGVKADSDGFNFAADISLNEGKNTVTVAATDKDGKALATKASYSVDLLTKAPEITITSPSSNPYNTVDQSSIIVKGNIKFEEISDNNQISAASSAGDLLDGTYDSSTGDFTLLVPVSGFTTISIEAVDAAKNVSEKSFNVVAIMDNEPLNIDFGDLPSIQTLLPSQANNDVLTIKGSVNHRPKVFQINGVDINVNNDLTFSQDFKLQQGRNKFTVYAVDTNNVIAYNSCYSVIYDSVAPQFKLTEPQISADGKIYTNKDAVELKGTISDNTYGYSLYINGDAVVSADNFPQTGNEKSFDYTAAVQNGSIIKFEAVDGSGNSLTEDIPVVVDKTAPNKPSITLSNSAATNKSIFATIAADSSDKDVSKLEYSFDNSTWKTYNAPVSIDQNGTIYARATDNAGNVSEVAKLEVTNIDKTAPKAPVITLKNNVVTITADPSDNDVAKLEYSLDNKTWKTYSSPFTMTANGTVYARATDKVGNVGDVAKLNVTGITNTSNGQLPKTGSMVNFGSLLGLGSMMTILGAVVLLKKKKETN